MDRPITHLPNDAATLQARFDGLANAGHVVELVDSAIAEGIGRGASDIHFEPTSANLLVKFRIDGVLHSAGQIPVGLAANVVARLKVISDLLTYRTDIPQEGGVRPASAAIGPDLRVSTIPTVHGEKAVVRVFRADTPLTGLHDLGLPESIYQQLTTLLNERTGAIFLTGPSGSGKTTTIYACLHHLVRGDSGRHIVTVEDPVERLVPGVSQSQVRPGTEFDFARGLRSLLRHDPDVIMVGEIRDRETAATAAEAALTGHLVFSTLHSGSAAGVVSRLLDMGVEPHLLTSGLRAILNQRLLRRLCLSCRGVGCPACRSSGFHGRLLVAELLVPDAAFRKAILARADLESLEAVARAGGLRPIRAAAQDQVAAGHTTAEEVDRVLGPEPRT
ncbi:MAG: GspE/PulE family protein [Gemmataceae bacterium]|nr:GspE/PulE family protein [Gemmataceae bacterium]